MHIAAVASTVFTSMKSITLIAAFLTTFVLTASGQSTIGSAKKPFPPSTETFQIPSHGAKLNAMVYIAEGAGPHPVVVLLHGFPGNERNLDLAQDIRRAGWDVLYFNYRGSWGTPGNFSFGHSIEDVASAVSYLRQADNAKLLRLDPKRIVLIGHSMGGFMAVEAAAADPAILGVALISAADMPGRVPEKPLSKDAEPAFVQQYAALLAANGMAPLAGCTPEGLVRELIDNAGQWRFSAKVDALRNRPFLVVTSDDGLKKMGDDLASGLKRSGNRGVNVEYLRTDHVYSDKRLELSATLRGWLETLMK